MAKMTLERFRELKIKIKEILDENLDYNEETGNYEFPEINEDIDFETAFETIFKEIESSDLSDIPFEEYEGFYDFGYDFSNTKANLDFSLMNEYFRGKVPVRAKGCNVRNFDFDNLAYSEDSFDEDFVMANKDRFWGLDREDEIPKDVRDRYNKRRLTIEDIQEYKLYDIDMDRLDWNDRDIMKYIPRDVIPYVDKKLFNAIRDTVAFHDLTYTRNDSIKDLEDYFDFMKHALLEKTSYVINPEFYEVISESVDARVLIPEYIIDFPEDKYELKQKYLEGKLELKDIVDNYDLFKDKRFASRMDMITFMFDYDRGSDEDMKDLNDHFSYVIENLPELAYTFKNDESTFAYIANFTRPSKTPEENIEILKNELAKNIQSLDKKDLERLPSIFSPSEIVYRSIKSAYIKDTFDEILKDTSFEKMDASGISPMNFSSYEFLCFFEHVGFDRVMEFDAENDHVFTKNNCAVLHSMYERHIHYANNNHNQRTNLYTKRLKDDETYDRSYNQEEFDELMKRIIREEVEDTQEKQIDYRNFSDRFKKAHPEMFLPENAPDELKELFYSQKIDLNDLADNPEWIQYLKETNYYYGLKKYTTLISQYDGKYSDYNYATLTEFLSEQAPKEEGLNFLVKNRNAIKFFHNTYCLDRSSELCVIIKEGFKDEEMLDVFQDRINTAFKETLSFDRNINYDLLKPYIDKFLSFDAAFTSQLDFEQIKLSEDYIKNHSPEEYEAFLDSYIVSKIKEGKIAYNEKDGSVEFKEKHPELYLDKDAPEDLKNRFYTNRDGIKIGKNPFNLKNSIITLDQLMDENYSKYLEGKYFPKASFEIMNLQHYFSTNEIVDLAKTDLESTKIYGTTEQNALRMRNLLDSQKFNKEDLLEHVGLFIYGPEELEKSDLAHYMELKEINSLKSSENCRRDLYESILGSMYGFLGYDMSKKLLLPPEITAEELDQVYEIDGRIKDLYIKKFELDGNIKALSTLFSSIPRLLPGEEKVTSKANLNLFKSLNILIKEDYSGNIDELLTEVLKQNNQPVNEEGIKELTGNVNKIYTDFKLDKIKEYTSSSIEENIQENRKTRRRIKEIYRDALKYSLLNSEKVSPKLVQEYLENEFAKKNEDGNPFYSPHVTDHLQELVGFSNELSNHPEYSKIVNKTLVDCLHEESQKVGNRWIMKIAQASNYPPKMTYEEIIQLEKSIYGEDSDLEIDTKETTGLKKLDEKDRKKLDEILQNANYEKALTFLKAENMFSGMNKPYSEELRKFFIKNEAEFMKNPELFLKLPEINRRFDSIISDPLVRTRYKEGLFTTANLLESLNDKSFENVERGDHELVYYGKSKMSQDQFDLAKKFMEITRKREATTIPPVSITNKRYRGRVVRIDSPLHYAIGEITNCCQTFGQNDPGESSMIHSATEHNGSLFVVEEIDEYGRPLEVVAQSWVWRNGNRITFDNAEIPHGKHKELEKIGGFDEVMDAYVDAAKEMIETDKKALKKLVDSGKISKEEYKRLVLKDATMGTGCDDLISDLSSEKKKEHPHINDESVPIEINKTYTGTIQRSLYRDSKSIVLIAHNDEFDEKDHVNYASEVIDKGIKYKKSREVFHRKGSNIDADLIEKIKETYEKNPDAESHIFKNKSVTYIGDVIEEALNDSYIESETMDSFRVAMSESADWFILSEEKNNSIVIQDSLIDTSKKENLSETEKLDKKLSLQEYQTEMLAIMLEAKHDGKDIVINQEREGKFFDFNSLAEKDEIEISDNGHVNIKDEEKLKKRIEALQKLNIEDTRNRNVSQIDEKEDR